MCSLFASSDYVKVKLYFNQQAADPEEIESVRGIDGQGGNLEKHRARHSHDESKSDASFGPEASMYFAGNQRSPYQDFLKRCGGNPQQLGYSSQSRDVLSPGMNASSPGHKQNKQHNNPRSSSYVPGGHNKQFPDENRNRGKTQGNQSTQSNQRSATKGRGQGNNRRKQVWKILGKRKIERLHAKM